MKMPFLIGAALLGCMFATAAFGKDAKEVEGDQTLVSLPLPAAGFQCSVFNKTDVDIPTRIQVWDGSQFVQGLEGTAEAGENFALNGGSQSTVTGRCFVYWYGFPSDFRGTFCGGKDGFYGSSVGCVELIPENDF